MTEGMMMQVDQNDGSDGPTNPFDPVVPVIIDNCGPTFDKFSFDSEILDDFSDVAQDAAKASSHKGAASAEMRAEQQRQQRIPPADLSTRISEKFSPSEDVPTETFLPGSTTPITRERIAAASKSSLAKLQEDQAYNTNKNMAALPPLHGGLLKTLSSQSMNSDKLMNDFIGEIDSFDDEVLRQEQEQEAIRREEANLSQALNEALYMSPSRENSGTFLAFEKIDEERLRATSKSPSREEGFNYAGESRLGSNQPRRNGNDGTSTSIRSANVIEEGKARTVVEAPQVVDRQSESGIKTLKPDTADKYETETKIPQAPIVGVSIGVELEERKERAARGWLSENWRTPQFVGLAVGIVIIVSAIIVCIALLLGAGTNSSNAVESSQDTNGRRLFIRGVVR